MFLIQGASPNVDCPLVYTVRVISPNDKIKIIESVAELEYR